LEEDERGPSMTNKKEAIIQQLKSEILTLSIKPGENLSEATLTERFGLSRTPVRDILKILEQEDYVHIYPKRGSLVSYIDLDSVEQVIYMRHALEKEVLKDLCQKLSLKGLHELTVILSKQKACIQDNSDLSDFIRYDDLFHKTCFTLCGREFLWAVIQQCAVHYTRYRELHMLNKEKLINILKEHQLLLTYLQQHDAKSIDSWIFKHLKADVNSIDFIETYSSYLKTNS